MKLLHACLARLLQNHSLLNAAFKFLVFCQSPGKILECFPKPGVNSPPSSVPVPELRSAQFENKHITDLALPCSSSQQPGLSSSTSEAPPASYQFWLDSEPTNSLSEKNCPTCFPLSQSICSKTNCGGQNSSNHLELSGKTNPI